MFISPFTPLFFFNHKTDGIESEYIQTFATSDQIFIEIIGKKSDEIKAYVVSEPDGKEFFEIHFNEWEMNPTTCLRFIALTLPCGMYSINIIGIGKSKIFMVTDCQQELNKTTLIQYSMSNNRQRTDAVFLIDGMQHFFDFRVPGGFKDSSWSFSVENEQFVTDQSDIVQLYALESVQRKFTLGNSQGCPIWFAEMLNRILCCSYVYFDGERYARKESGVPEITVQLDGINSFVFSQSVQKVANINPTITEMHQMMMRRIGADKFRSINDSYNRII